MIKWFTENGVAANLLAAVIIVIGFFVASNIKLELFPKIDLDVIRIQIGYPGASPNEVESAVVEIVEDKIQDIEGIKKISSYAGTNGTSIYVEIERQYDTQLLVEKIKSRIDAIDNFPEDVKEPQIEKVNIRNEVISLAIFGNTTQKELKKIADYVKDELKYQKNISQVDIKGIPSQEISISVSKNVLQTYDITLEEIANSINKEAVDVPGGSIKAKEGEFLLRTKSKSYYESEFENIPIISNDDGSTLRIKDIGLVKDSFVEDKVMTSYNGSEAIILRIFSIGDQNALKVASDVKDFSRTISDKLPEGISIEAFRDFTFYLKSRLNMLIENGIKGLILVFIILTLFLRPSLAFFVMLGIPISFLGAFIFLPFLEISINLASLFGFILVLGIVVDDAIIVGESIFTENKNPNISKVEASIRGTRRVSVPVIFAILTTIVAFIPILTIPGFLGKFFFPIPVVVISTLIFSLIESKLILPYHLTLCNKKRSRKSESNWFLKKQKILAKNLENFININYRSFIKKTIEYRYHVITLFTSILLIMLSLLIGNHLKFVFFPPVPSDYIIAKVIMPEGTQIELTQIAVQKVEEGLNKLTKDLKSKGFNEVFDNRLITIGGTVFDGSGGPMGENPGRMAPNRGEIAVELFKREDLASGGKIKELSAPNLANKWREMIAPVIGAKSISFEANAAGRIGAPINVQLSGRNLSELKNASFKIKQLLSNYNGLYDIRDNFNSGKKELELKLKPNARLLGLNHYSLGNQIRSAFFGIEVQRIQRKSNDLKVMLRYPKEERLSISDLDNLIINLPNGEKTILSEVAEYNLTESLSTIRRINQKRVINVRADADKDVADLELIKSELYGTDDSLSLIEKTLGEFPNVNWSLEGESREQKDIYENLSKMTIITILIIYALLAIPLKSYLQPLIIMLIIPYGLIGAIAGHFILFQPMSILSLLGFVALTGVLVNDSLLLIDYINKERKKGTKIKEAIENSAIARFRPIVLTSLTTFAGLFPVLFESSLQAQFLIPMAISLSFGILFATFITLILVPAFYNVLEDIKSKC